MRTTTSPPPRRTRFAAAGTSLRAASFSEAGTLSSRSSWMQSAPRVWALSTYFSTLTGTYMSERQTGRSGFTGDDAFLFQSSLYFQTFKPRDFKISSLCWPSLGAGVRIEPGVPSRRGTTWCIGNWPMSASG